MTWCERCAIGIHFRCADDHAIGHSGDDHIGNYCAKDIAAKSFLCHDCWSTHKPYVDESDEEEIEGDTNPERHPNRLRWRWPGRLKEALDTAARRERAARAEAGRRPSAAGDGRAARRPRRASGSPPGHASGRRRADPPGRRRPLGTRPSERGPPPADTPPRRQFPRRGATRLPCPP